MSDQTKRPSRLFGQYIIKHRFQFKLGLWLFAFLAVTALFLWGESRMIVNQLLAQETINDERIIQQLQLVPKILGQTALIIIVVSFGLALILSHYLAGPIYRFEKTFEELKNGNIGVQIRLRKRDEFKDMAALFNQAIASIRQKIRQERESAIQSVEPLRSVAKAVSMKGMESEAKQIEHIASELEKTQNQLNLGEPR